MVAARHRSGDAASVKVALAAMVLGLWGCAANRQATKACGHVDNQWFFTEVPLSGTVDCISCCRGEGAEDGSFSEQEGCRCYGSQDSGEPATRSEPASRGKPKRDKPPGIP